MENVAALFEVATRKKFRFPSVKGDLSVEQLWDLTLSSKNGLDLDAVAKEVNRELKSVTEESFVQTVKNPAKPELELKLEVVKYIIAFKINEAQVKANKAAKAEKRRQLVEQIAQRDVDALQKKSKEELLAELAAVDADD